MADVQECIGKLVATGTITRAIADQALDMFRRSREEYSKSMGPAGADAAAALQAAKELSDIGAKKQLAIASGVKSWRDIEQRVIDDPRGGMLQVIALMAKDTLLGDSRLNALRRENPEHPIFRGGSVDSNRQVIRNGLYNALGPEIDKFKGAGAAANAKDLIREIRGVDTGNQAAKAVAAGWNAMVKAAVKRAQIAGKVFEPLENWFTPQPWESRRVGKFTEAEFVKDFRGEIDSRGLKLIDKETQPRAAGLFGGPTGRYAAPDRFDDILKKAYADIKHQGGTDAPFSNEMRTFEFQPGEAGAQSWLRLQAKYGVGNEIMSMLDQHIDRMSSDIARHEIFGPNPQAAFEAALRLAKEKNPKEALSVGLRRFDSELTARNTFNQISGKGLPVGNEVWARRMAGTRQLLGAAALRNLPVSIVPSDTVMTFLSAHHDGMSGLDIIGHTFSGKMTRQEAAHLQIAAHSYSDFAQNNARRYPDELNVSGLARAVPNFVVKATGADLWTRNLRLGYQLSYFHQLANLAGKKWDQLPANLRQNFFSQYGFTPAEWDKIRSIEADVAPNGAKYVNLPALTAADSELSERLQRAVGERSSYGAHQPDARTRAIAIGSATRGTPAGEFALSVSQYRQFPLERMSTHLMRVLYEGSKWDRTKYGIAFALLSTAAGAVSLQAANVLAGKNTDDMSNPTFWVRAFAKGGAGGIYGDLLSDALRGDVGAAAGFVGGPAGGLLTDIAKAPFSFAKGELFDKQGRRTSDPYNEAFNTGRRWTPNTWYTKLAVDRLFWDNLQALLDPHYRESFRRAEKNAKKGSGQGYWFGPGAAVP